MVRELKIVKKGFRKLLSPTNTSLLLGIDLGTSGVKAGIYDPKGCLIGLGRSSNYTFYSPKPGWSQSDPELWWKDIILSIKAACKEASIKADQVCTLVYRCLLQR